MEETELPSSAEVLPKRNKYCSGHSVTGPGQGNEPKLQAAQWHAEMDK